MSIQDVLLSYGALHQVCDVATRKDAALQLILTDLHTVMYPPTAHPPIQVDDGKKGKDGDHKTLILAPKASKEFVIRRQTRKIKTRPMPESKIEAFCSELTRHKWVEIESSDDVNIKTNLFHEYLRQLYEKHFPAKTVNISNLDKNWITPQLKLLLRQAQRERVKHGKKGKFKQLWAKFRRMKKANIKSFYKKYVEELKTSQPGKWYQMLKKLGGIDQMDQNKIEIESLRGMSDRECAEAVAQSFCEVSQSYNKLDRTQLPAFLPAGRPEQVTLFQVMERIKNMKSTKSTLPIDIPDKLRKECSVDIAEPICNIINTCLRDGKFPVAWRREWVTPVPKTTVLKTCKDVRKIASTSDYSKLFETFL